MRQRALKPGVLANPYRYVEAGQVFEHAMAMLWAEPVDEEQAADEAAELEPEAAEADPAPAPSRRKRKTPTQPAGGEADPI
jgi:hypothetical protein